MRVIIVLALLLCIGTVTAVAQERLRKCQSRCMKYRHGQERLLCKFRCQKTLPESDQLEIPQSDPASQLQDCRQKCQTELKEDKKEMMKCESDCSKKFERQRRGAGTRNPEEEEHEMQQEAKELEFSNPARKVDTISKITTYTSCSSPFLK